MPIPRPQSDPARTLQAVLSTFKGGFTGANQALEERRKQQRDIELLQEEARLKQQSEATDPINQARQQALQVINQLFPQRQQPELTLSPNAPEEGANRLRELFAQRSEEATSGNQERLRAIQTLLGKGDTTSPTFILNQAGQAEPLMTSEGQAVTGNAKIITSPQSLESKIEEKRALTKAGEQAKTEETLGNARRTVDRILELLDKIPPPDSDPSGKFTRIPQNIGAGLGFNPDLNEFNVASKAILGQLSKTVSKEGGKLTEQDIERVSELLIEMPFLSETSRQRRKNTIDAFLGEKGFDPIFSGDQPTQQGTGSGFRVIRELP